MVSALKPTPAFVDDRESRDFAELEASRRVMVDRMKSHIDWLVKMYGISRTEADERARAPMSAELPEQPPEHTSWWEIERALEDDPARGQALWQRVKDEARRELRTGVRPAVSLERRISGTPFERAQYLAIVESLVKALQPNNGLEALLVQQMASAYEQHLRWQTLASNRIEEETWHGERDMRRALDRMSPREREQHQDREGWLPARLTDSEAIEQAVMIADRYQRSFLRLVKAFRDNRRLFTSLVVAGGQVNIGEQQVNVAGNVHSNDKQTTD
jgi:hypothetical protein